MAKDPVCGMMVDENKAAAKAEHNGTIYYFCSPGCKTSFEQDPDKYAKSEGKMEMSGHGGCCC